MLPPYGFAAPAWLVAVRDSRRIEVSLDEFTRLVIQLSGLSDPGPPGASFALEARHFIEAALEEADVLSIQIPVPIAVVEAFRDHQDRRRPATVEGEIWVGTETKLSDMLVHAGLASREPRISAP